MNVYTLSIIHPEDKGPAWSDQIKLEVWVVKDNIPYKILSAKKT